jgi:hypothetical protein
MRTSFLVLALVLCAGSPAYSGTTAQQPATAKAPAKVLPFIHDDYARALNEARTKQVPLFVETWAAW